MIVLGVTGKYCAGKDMASEILREYRFEIIDVDALGHDALHSEKTRVINRFGSDVDAGGGEVDRRRLGRVVFSNAAALEDLESIVHPVMVEAVEGRISTLQSLVDPPVGVIINAAVLFRMGLERLCDLVLLIRAPFRSRYRRARQRDRVTLFGVVRRIRSQRDVLPQFSNMDADIHSVRNDGSREQLRAKLKSLLSLP